MPQDLNITLSQDSCMNIAQMLNDSIQRRKTYTISEQQKKKSELKKGSASIGQPSMKGQAIEPNQKGTVTKTPIEPSAISKLYTPKEERRKIDLQTGEGMTPKPSNQLQSWTATSSGYPVYDVIPPAPYSKDYIINNINKSVAEAGGLARPQEQKGKVTVTPSGRMPISQAQLFMFNKSLSERANQPRYGGSPVMIDLNRTGEPVTVARIKESLKPEFAPAGKSILTDFTGKNMGVYRYGQEKVSLQLFKATSIVETPLERYALLNKEAPKPLKIGASVLSGVVGWGRRNPATAGIMIAGSFVAPELGIAVGLSKYPRSLKVVGGVIGTVFAYQSTKYIATSPRPAYAFGEVVSQTIPMAIGFKLGMKMTEYNHPSYTYVKGTSYGETIRTDRQITQIGKVLKQENQPRILEYPRDIIEHQTLISQRSAGFKGVMKPSPYADYVYFRGTTVSGTTRILAQSGKRFSLITQGGSRVVENMFTMKGKPLGTKLYPAGTDILGTAYARAKLTDISPVFGSKSELTLIGSKSAKAFKFVSRVKGIGVTEVKSPSVVHKARISANAEASILQRDIISMEMKLTQFGYGKPFKSYQQGEIVYVKYKPSYKPDTRVYAFDYKNPIYTATFQPRLSGRSLTSSRLKTTLLIRSKRSLGGEISEGFGNFKQTIKSIKLFKGKSGQVGLIQESLPKIYLELPKPKTPKPSQFETGILKSLSRLSQPNLNLLFPVPKLRQESYTKNLLKQKVPNNVRLEPEVKNRLRIENKLRNFVKSKNILELIPTPVSKTQLRTRTKVETKTQTKIETKLNIGINTRSITGINITGFKFTENPLPPEIPLWKRRSYTKVKAPKRSLSIFGFSQKYQPDLTAIVFGQKGKQPSWLNVEMGLPRPMVR
jgi:hypothetical protein